MFSFNLLLRCNHHRHVGILPCVESQTHKLSSQFSSVTQAHLTLCDPNGLQYARLPCLTRTPRAYSNSCPLSWWCHPAISSFVIPFSSCLQSVPASGSFQMSQFFTSGGQSIRISASASVLPVTIRDWFPLGWTGWILTLLFHLQLQSEYC